MKWIKTFEELTPRIYRNAGSRFMDIPHKVEKGRKLKDYGSEKEWGVYNIELVRNYNDITREVKFTKPKAKFILNKKVTQENNMNTRYEDISVEEMLDLWKDGERNLYFTIQFYFEPLEETKSRMSSLPTWGDIPLFSFKVDLSSWEDSLEQYNTPDEYEDDIENFKTFTLQELYDETSSLSISLALPQSDPRNSWASNGNGTIQIYHYGIFSDRNSAFKFKKLLPTLIDDEVEEKIWEVFSLLGDSKNFQRCIHALKYGVRINHLYDDVKSFSSYDAKNPSKWFRWNIADIPREVPKKEIKEEEPKQLEQPKEEPKSMWYQSRT